MAMANYACDKFVVDCCVHCAVGVVARTESFVSVKLLDNVWVLC